MHSLMVFPEEEWTAACSFLVGVFVRLILPTANVTPYFQRQSLLSNLNRRSGGFDAGKGRSFWGLWGEWESCLFWLRPVSRFRLNRRDSRRSFRRQRRARLNGQHQSPFPGLKRHQLWK